MAFPSDFDIKAPEFRNVPVQDTAGKALESIGAVDEVARGRVVLTAANTNVDYVVQTDKEIAPYIVFVCTEAVRYNESGSSSSTDFLIPASIPWKINNPGIGATVGFQTPSTTLPVEVSILETD